MEAAHHMMLIGGALGLLAIGAGLFATRIGTPILLVFLVLGMLAGEDGPGGIKFDDFQGTYELGSVALVVILFEGGLKTSLKTLRAVFAPSFAMATIGVAITACLVGVAARLIADIDWAPSSSAGALVAPTDAAAVAAVLRTSKVAVPDRVIAVLEVESGLNDPMAVFLTLLLIEAIRQPADLSLAHGVWFFLQEMLGGALLGGLIGWLLSIMMRAPRLEASLLPVAMLAGAWAMFGGAQLLGTSGFLAVYVAGIIVGDRAGIIVGDRAGIIVGDRAGARHASLERAFEAFAWVAQIGLFVMLGLLVNPHDLLPLAASALVAAAALIFVARPLAALVCLLPFGFRWNEIGFVAWVGLRGAVPIYLAIIPVLQGVPNGELGFAVAFVIVLTSLAVQGWSIAPVARLLRLART
jgi:cell volume regulation protein A